MTKTYTLHAVFSFSINERIYLVARGESNDFRLRCHHLEHKFFILCRHFRGHGRPIRVGCPAHFAAEGESTRGYRAGVEVTLVIEYLHVEPAMTHAGLKYNTGFLKSQEIRMVSRHTWVQKSFESCFVFAYHL